MRELAEETGYTAREWAYAGRIHNAPAYATESIWIWFARGLVGGKAQLDEGEFVETVRLSEVARVYDSVENNESQSWYKKESSITLAIVLTRAPTVAGVRPTVSANADTDVAVQPSDPRSARSKRSVSRRIR